MADDIKFNNPFDTEWDDIKLEARRPTIVERLNPEGTPALKSKLEAEFKKRLEKYAPLFGYSSGEELKAAMDEDPALYDEVIDIDDGDNFLALYQFYPDVDGIWEDTDDYYNEPLVSILSEIVGEPVKEDLKEYYDDPDYWCDQIGPMYLVSYKGNPVCYLEYPYAGDPAYGGTVPSDKEILARAEEAIQSYMDKEIIANETIDESQISYTSVDEDDLGLDLDVIDTDYDFSLEEHIQDRPAPVESTQEYQGVDNAVVDCKKYTLVAHSEDEKPVDCKMEKPALEEPLAGEKLNLILTEATSVDTVDANLDKIFDFSLKALNKADDVTEKIEQIQKQLDALDMDKLGVDEYFKEYDRLNNELMNLRTQQVSSMTNSFETVSSQDDPIYDKARELLFGNNDDPTLKAMDDWFKNLNEDFSDEEISQAMNNGLKDYIQNGRDGIIKLFTEIDEKLEECNACSAELGKTLDESEKVVDVVNAELEKVKNNESKFDENTLMAAFHKKIDPINKKLDELDQKYQKLTEETIKLITFGRIVKQAQKAVITQKQNKQATATEALQKTEDVKFENLEKPIK